MQTGSKNSKQASGSSMAVAAETKENWKGRREPKLQGDAYGLGKDYQQMNLLLAVRLHRLKDTSNSHGVHHQGRGF